MLNTNMKQLLVFFINFIIFFEVSGQQLSVQLSKDDYLKKSKRQQTTGIVLVSGGFAVSAVGLVVAVVSTPFAIADGFGGNTGGTESMRKGTALIYTGLIAMAGSVPFFVASGKNKKKAMQANITFHVSKFTPEASAILRQKHIPCVGIKVQF